MLKIIPTGREQATYILWLIHLAHFKFLQRSGENMSFRMVLKLFNWARQIPSDFQWELIMIFLIGYGCNFTVTLQAALIAKSQVRIL